VEKEYEASRDLNILFTTLGLERFVERFTNNPNINFDRCEQLLIDVEKDNLNIAYKEALDNHHIYKDKWDNSFCLTFTERYNSEIGDYLLQKLNIEYVLIINAKKSKVSLRSRGSFDVSKIAVTFGGGGHKNAAGFKLDMFGSAADVFKKIGLIN